MLKAIETGVIFVNTPLECRLMKVTAYS